MSVKVKIITKILNISLAVCGNAAYHLFVANRGNIAMSTWQRIETAPHEEEVLTWDGDYRNIADLSDGVWRVISGDDYAPETFGSMAPLIITPTHWMPLPEPPDA
jgi:hypothetical protein